MDLMKFTNLVIKKAFEKGLDANLLLSVDDESHDEPSPQVQIDIENEHYAAFSLFYALADDSINFSSIFEPDNRVDETIAKEAFEEEQGIFQSIIFEEETTCVHLYTKLDKAELSEEYVEEILDFLADKKAIKVVSYLK